MEMWNHEPFYNSNDNDGVYKGDCSIESVQLLYYSTNRNYNEVVNLE